MALMLRGAGLRGTLPAALAGLASLEVLQLAANPGGWVKVVPIWSQAAYIWFVANGIAYRM